MSEDLPAGLSDRGRDAYQSLRTADRFEENFIGIAAQPSSLVAAFRILFAEAGADAVFKRLLAEATPAGRLYALCGVYFTDPASFAALAEAHRGCTDPVRVQSGCLGFGVPFADILEDKTPQAVRLAGPDSSLMDWRRTHPERNKPDVIGGGYPHAFAKSLF